MTRIYLIRHAQSAGNIEKRLTGRKEYVLTEQGKKQANQLASFFKEIKIDAFYSSPYQRTIDTIKPLANENKKEIYLNDNLSEMDFGIYDGFKWEDVNKIDPEIHEKHIETNEIMNIPNQESTKQTTDRMYKVIREISDKNKDKNIVIASHGVAIETFLRKITNEPFDKNREKYSQKNASINILEYDEEEQKYHVELINSIEHLNEDKKI